MNRDYRLKVSLSKRIEHCSLRSSMIDKDGNPLSHANTQLVQRVLEMWIRMIVDVLSSVASVEEYYDVCCSWLSTQPQTLDISCWIADLELLADRLIHNRTLNLEGRDTCDMWLLRLFRSKFIKRAPRRDLYNLLKFPKRITLSNVDSLKATTEEAFFTNADRIEALNDVGEFTTEESKWIQQWLVDYEAPTLDDCSHSSGSTANPYVKQHIKEKYAYLTEDPFTWKFCVRNRIPTYWKYSGEFESTRALELYKQGVAYKPNIEDYEPNRVVFVPKSYKTYRSVAMESHNRIFYQNGVAQSLRKVIDENLQKNIDLTDQSRSKVLAQEASKSTAFATIDFSMASDSVSLGLFEAWFGNTNFGKDALLLRSRTFEYEDVEYENPIAFTMGSPLCFPVECLVFLAMAYATIEQEGGDPTTETVYVYGDDVIIPSKYAEAFMERAVKNGFLPNADKSYWRKEDKFREACGMEAYDGEDITPMYVPRRLTGKVETSYCSYVHIANAAYCRGYFGLRKKVLWWLSTDVVTLWDYSKKKRRKRPFRRASFVTYSDNVDVLTNESSSYVFDPEAGRLNKSIVRFLKRPYDTRFVPKDKVQKEKYVLCISNITVPDCARSIGKRAEEMALYSYRLHYKPSHKKEKYGRRDAIAKALAHDQDIFKPELICSLEHAVTRMAMTIRPYEAVED